MAFPFRFAPENPIGRGGRAISKGYGPDPENGPEKGTTADLLSQAGEYKSPGKHDTGKQGSGSTCSPIIAAVPNTPQTHPLPSSHLGDEHVKNKGRPKVKYRRKTSPNHPLPLGQSERRSPNACSSPRKTDFRIRRIRAPNNVYIIRIYEFILYRRLNCFPFD